MPYSYFFKHKKPKGVREINPIGLAVPALGIFEPMRLLLSNQTWCSENALETDKFNFQHAVPQRV